MLREEKSPQFDFNEIVRIIGQREPIKEPVIGLEGYIAGRAQDGNGVWGYAVFLCDFEECWSFDEDMLQTTGEVDESEPTGMSIRIRMEGQRGIVVSPDDESCQRPHE